MIDNSVIDSRICGGYFAIIFIKSFFHISKEYQKNRGLNSNNSVDTKKSERLGANQTLLDTKTSKCLDKTFDFVARICLLQLAPIHWKKEIELNTRKFSYYCLVFKFKIVFHQEILMYYSKL